MKVSLLKYTYFFILSSVFTGCVGTSGSGARTASHVYQPTISSNVEIFVEKPTKPYYVIGTVGSRGGEDASMDALIRAMQKEAAERGCRTRCPRDHNLDKSRDKFPGGNTKHASDGDKVAG